MITKRNANVPWNDSIKRRLKLRELDILLAVIQSRGMAKAAVRLNMTQPAVSKAIADLEQTLGVRLVDRGRRGVEPTSFGRSLIKRSIAIFDELRQGVEDIEFLSDPTAGELRIGTSESMAAGPVLAIIERLNRRYPRMVFNIVIGDAEKLCHELVERNIEFAISRITQRVDEAQFDLETLFYDSLVVAAGTQSPWARRRKISLPQLMNEPWALMPFDTVPGGLMAQALHANGLERPRATVITLSLNMRNRLLATGRFLTILPAFTLTLPGMDSSIKALPVGLPSTRGPVAIITLHNRTLTPLAQMFIARVREFGKSLARREGGVS